MVCHLLHHTICITFAVEGYIFTSYVCEYIFGFVSFLFMPTEEEKSPGLFGFEDM